MLRRAENEFVNMCESRSFVEPSVRLRLDAGVVGVDDDGGARCHCVIERDADLRATIRNVDMRCPWRPACVWRIASVEERRANDCFYSASFAFCCNHLRLAHAVVVPSSRWRRIVIRMEKSRAADPFVGHYSTVVEYGERSDNRWRAYSYRWSRCGGISNGDQSQTVSRYVSIGW